MSRPPRPSRLRFDRLDDRIAPAVFGNPWPEADRLTVSLLPDGKEIADQYSSLEQTLNRHMSGTVWQGEVRRAFQTWAAVTNVSFSFVSDNGKPFGEPGPVQGHPWFGDIRVGAAPLSSNVLAVSNPFDMVSSWAGEIVLNSNAAFNRGGGNGRHDLYTVLLQEVGHVLGVGNSGDPASVMFPNYQGTRGGLHASDAAAVQALYGPRTPDRFEPNESAGAARRLKFVREVEDLGATDGTQGGEPFVADGDLSAAGDADFYQFVTPAGTNDFWVSLRTAGVSLVRPKLTVYRPNGSVYAPESVETADGDLHLFFKDAQANARYRVKVEAATADVFGVGRYRLAAGKEAKEATARVAPAEFLTAAGKRAGDDGPGKNDTLAAALDLGDARPSADARWDVTGRAAITSPADADFFRVRAGADAGPVLVATVWATEVEKLDPLLTVFDAAGQAVPFELLRNDGSTYSLQVANVQPGSPYTVRVRATDPHGSYKEGGYFLALDFRDDPIALTEFAAGSLTAAAAQAFRSLTVTRSQSFRFELAATGPAAAGVQMVVYDSQRNVVFAQAARGGEVVAGDAWLVPGEYTVRFVGSATSGPLPPVAYRARFVATTDPVGPALIDATGTPAGGTGPGYTWWERTDAYYLTFLTLTAPTASLW